MTARKGIRTQPCDRNHARNRLNIANRFLETAQLLESEQDPASGSVAASLAVLSGIAAADAACCVSLGYRSRAADHRDAASLLEDITLGGAAAANAMKRLISLKDKAQYGMLFVSNEELISAIRNAEKLVYFANEVLLR